jgi:hypothetical protein
MFPQYVVAAATRRRPPVTSRLPGDESCGADRPTDLPVGVRHAVQPDTRTRNPLIQALCGQDVTGWALFLGFEFTGHAGADCRRCAQLVRRGAIDDRSAPRRQPGADG